MIFSLKQGMYTAVLLGNKRLTTRLKLPAHIRKGAIWAIVPGRAKPAWWLDDRPHMPVFRHIHCRPSIITSPREFLMSIHAEDNTRNTALINNTVFALGYAQAAILIEDYYPNPLGDMDDQDARDEGFEDMAGFIRTWNAINPAVPFAFNMNREVWRVRFDRQDIVREAVERIGRSAILAAAQPAPTPRAV